MWAMCTSICSIVMCVTYAVLICNEKGSEYNSLTGGFPFIPHLITVIFRALAVFFFLSHSLYKLREKNSRLNVFLWILVIMSSIFSFLGVIWGKCCNNKYPYLPYFTQGFSFISAILVIFIVGILLKLRLNKLDPQLSINDSIATTPSCESLKFDIIPTKQQEDAIDDVSKQVLLSFYQSLFLIIYFIFEVSMNVYYGLRNENMPYYIFQTIQDILFCIVVIGVNLFIWFSIQYTHKWYLNCCKIFCFCCNYSTINYYCQCCWCRHDALKDRIENAARVPVAPTNAKTNNNNNINNNNNYNIINNQLAKTGPRVLSTVL